MMRKLFVSIATYAVFQGAGCLAGKDKAVYVTKASERLSNPFGNALVSDLVADQSVSEIDGVFYLYATTDGWGQGNADKAQDRVESFNIACAIDASNGSRWMAGPDDAEKWLMLNPGKTCKIKRTEAYFVKPITGHAYTLEYSLGGKNWKPYVGHEKVILRTPYVDKKSVYAHKLGSVS